MKDDYVATVETGEAWRELIHQYVLARLKRRSHRTLLHTEGLGDEALEQVEGDHGEDDGLADLNQEVALAHGGSIGVT